MNLIQQLIQHSSAHAPSRVIGIDLGTTNCTVAQVKCKRPKIDPLPLR